MPDRLQLRLSLSPIPGFKQSAAVLGQHGPFTGTGAAGIGVEQP